MAYENIEITQPNFCIAPLVGTFATVDTTNDTAYLRIKNDTGGTAKTYTFNPNIPKDTIIRNLDYVGPRNVSVLQDGMRFFTVESNYSDSVTIKSWILNTVDNRLDFDYSFTKTSTSVNKFVVKSATFGKRITKFGAPTVTGTGYITLDSVKNIKVGTKLYLGPSTVSSYINECETVSVTSVSGTTVFVSSSVGTPPLKYYNIDDQVTYVDNCYICSDAGYQGDTTNGTFYIVDVIDGSLLEKDYNAIYKNVDAIGCSLMYLDTVGIVKCTELIYLDVNDFSIKRSSRINNILPDKYNYINVDDIEFTDTAIYRLQHSTVKRTDSGSLVQINWDTYNFQEDSVYRYTDSITIFSDPIGIVANNETIKICVVVRDQYGLGLSGKTVIFDKVSGDSGGTFGDPNKEAVTDINGFAYIDYTSGWYDQSNFDDVNGNITIKAYTDGSNILTGSIYVWAQITLKLNAKFIISSNTNPKGVKLIKQKLDSVTGINKFEQISEFESIFKLLSRACFYIPGGNKDCGTDPGTLTIVKQLREFTSTSILEQNEDFVSTAELQQWESEKDTVPISQTYISRHYTYGNSDTVEIAQFRFMIDMDPKPYSEKNNVNTHIWVKMAPYGFSLDQSTLLFKVREISYDGDTGWIDYTNSPYTVVTPFDAGGGLLGLELLFDPPWYFHNNALVYVYIQVYDQAQPANEIDFDYWFSIIDDYKAPFIINEFPERNAVNVPVNTSLYFDVMDNAVGVDINSLEVYLNTKHKDYTYTTISGGYHVIVDTSSNFYYTEEVEVSIKINDLSPRRNVLYDSWKFKSIESTKPCVDTESFIPKVCDRSAPSRTTYYEFNIYDCGDGIDMDSLVLLVDKKERKVTNKPIIKRIK